MRFLLSDSNPKTFMGKAEKTKSGYSGFNLLVADHDELWWLSNRDSSPRRLDPGIYGLGNFLLDTPEVAESKAQFAHSIDPVPSIEPLFTVLAAAKIVSPDYGTRCSTVLLRQGSGRMRFAERSFDAAGGERETAHYELTTSQIA